MQGPFPHLPSNIVFAELVSSREMLSSEFRRGDDSSPIAVFGILARKHTRAQGFSPLHSDFMILCISN